MALKRKFTFIAWKPGHEGIDHLIPYGIKKFTHYQMKRGGVLLTSTLLPKMAHQSKVFIPYDCISIIY